MFKKISFIPLVVILFVMIIGFIQINIINTKALSPLGTSDETYELVSKEFGEDFSEFIKDDSPIKIYTDDDVIVSISDNEYIITTDNPIINSVKYTYNSISSGINYIKTNVDNLIKNINTNNSDENPNDKIDSIIDGYIQKNNDENVNSTENEDSVGVSNEANNKIFNEESN